jgi:Zn finger protein HypA/HybF involved in hydrogenase expression
MANQQTVTDWTPPPGFGPVPSKVPGIVVYAPVPEEETTPGVETFRCPQCNGIVAYSASDEQLACPHCGYTQPVGAQRVGLAAERFEFTLQALDGSERGWGIERRQVQCEACNALYSVDEGGLSATCPFCGSNRVAGLASLHDFVRPSTMIPFTVDDKRCSALVREWMGRGWMHPPALRHIDAIGRLVGMYLPYWVFDAHVDAQWRAEVGYEEEKRVYRDGEWETETEIRWRWESGNVHLPIHSLPICGTDKISILLQERLQPYDLDALVTYDPDYLAGWQAQAYDIQLKPAWDLGKRRMREQAKDVCHSRIHSSHVRNFSMTADLNEERWRYVLLPAYLATYTLQNETYHVMVNGQTGVVAGQKPVAWLRVWLAVALLLLPGVSCGLLGLLTSLLAGVGAFLLPVALVLFVAGLVAVLFVLNQARSADDV